MIHSEKGEIEINGQPNEIFAEFSIIITSIKKMCDEYDIDYNGMHNQMTMAQDVNKLVESGMDIKEACTVLAINKKDAERIISAYEMADDMKRSRK